MCFFVLMYASSGSLAASATLSLDAAPQPAQLGAPAYVHTYVIIDVVMPAKCQLPAAATATPVPAPMYVDCRQPGP